MYSWGHSDLGPCPPFSLSRSEATTTTANCRARSSSSVATLTTHPILCPPPVAAVAAPLALVRARDRARAWCEVGIRGPSFPRPPCATTLVSCPVATTASPWLVCRPVHLPLVSSASPSPRSPLLASKIPTRETQIRLPSARRLPLSAQLCSRPPVSLHLAVSPPPASKLRSFVDGLAVWAGKATRSCDLGRRHNTDAASGAGGALSFRLWPRWLAGPRIDSF